MSNPFAQIRAGVETCLEKVAELHWLDVYAGEAAGDADADRWRKMRQKIATHGSGAAIRIMRTQLAPDAPVSCDHHDIYLQVIVGACAAADRKSSAEAAEDLAWHAYEALRDSTDNPDWLHERWYLIGVVVEDQGPSSTLMSLVLRSSADFARWTE